MVQIIPAETFYPAVAKLTANEAKLAIEFIIKFQQDPTNPGISLERLTNVRSDNIWSARVNQDLRAILCKDGSLWRLLYVDHHNASYLWARTRRVELEQGVLRIVEYREEIEHRVVVTHRQSERHALFVDHSDDYLASIGVPRWWLPAARQVLSQEDLINVSDVLEPDVQNSLWQLSEGRLVAPLAPTQERTIQIVERRDDAQRYAVLEYEDLLRTLKEPLARWIAFIHPSQRRLATGTFNGPVKVTGAAGTGKTVVAMHRARHLARDGKRVFLTSYSKTLCTNIAHNINLFCTDDERARIVVNTVHAQALALARRIDPSLQPLEDAEIEGRIDALVAGGVSSFTPAFVRSEWESVIVAQGIRSLASYRATPRTGRGTRLSAVDRVNLWQRVFGPLLTVLADEHKRTFAQLCQDAREAILAGTVENPFDAVIVDEVQDLGPQELLLLAALAAGNLMLLGDGGQRIYAQRFSLAKLGIAVRGRSHVLTINYRTTEQIRRAADRILGDTSDDLDGERERRHPTRSILGGPAPIVRGFASSGEQAAFVVERIQGHQRAGIAPAEIAVFARRMNLLAPIKTQLDRRDIASFRLTNADTTMGLGVNLGTLHRSKGLEFKIVFIVDVSEGELPHLPVTREPDDEGDALERERQLLYVGMTRARDELYVTWVERPSVFLINITEG